jgi:hypothetical protein
MGWVAIGCSHFFVRVSATVVLIALAGASKMATSLGGATMMPTSIGDALNVVVREKNKKSDAAQVPAFNAIVRSNLDTYFLVWDHKVPRVGCK